MGWIEPQQAQTRDGVSFVIQSVEEDDAAALLAYLCNSVGTGRFDVTEADEVDHAETSQRAWIAPLREADNSLLLAAWHDGRIIGSLNFHGGKRRKMVHSGHFGISVLADWRGRGVGSALLEALIRWAREHPVIEEITLGVVDANEGAIRLYQRHGFVEIGRHPGKFRLGPGRYWADVQMSLWVNGGPAPAAAAETDDGSRVVVATEAMK